MKKSFLTYLLIVFLLVVFAGQVTGDNPEQKKISLIVDTDVALDDIRALVLLLQSDEIDILGIVTSGGACEPEVAAINVRRVLRYLDRGNIPVLAGEDVTGDPPPWRPMSESLGWSTATIDEIVSSRGQSEENVTDPPEHIAESIEKAENRIIYLCLGSMTNLAAIIMDHPEVTDKIERIVCYGGVPHSDLVSWNTDHDLEASEVVFQSNLPITVVHFTEENGVTFDSELLMQIGSIETPGAKLISLIHSDQRVSDLVASGHMRCWDEMAVFSLLRREIFWFSKWRNPPLVEVSAACYTEEVRQLYLDLLSGDISTRHGHRDAVILKMYPIDPTLLRYDIDPRMESILERHGRAEWNAVLITSELHRHLGIYSILGAKMGIRAREILSGGLDELQVISRAGFEPPLSCITDGLQVSTGASLGRGKIDIDTADVFPEAVFMNDSGTLKLRLKNDEFEKIRKSFQQIIAEHGLLTPEYWHAVRESALQNWLDLDRRSIFEETFLEGGR